MMGCTGNGLAMRADGGPDNTPVLGGVRYRHTSLSPAAFGPGEGARPGGTTAGEARRETSPSNPAGSRAARASRADRDHKRITNGRSPRSRRCTTKRIPSSNAARIWTRLPCRRLSRVCNRQAQSAAWAGRRNWATATKPPARRRATRDAVSTCCWNTSLPNLVAATSSRSSCRRWPACILCSWSSSARAAPLASLTCSCVASKARA
mmetsp:Transcript_23861/g.54305  ORF Transcript_23861/g.54305 Transcript_23861/m.54305 type:complete len:207 (+) Transcript_23861:714-1334(+)